MGFNYVSQRKRDNDTGTDVINPIIAQNSMQGTRVVPTAENMSDMGIVQGMKELNSSLTPQQYIDVAEAAQQIPANFVDYPKRFEKLNTNPLYEHFKNPQSVAPINNNEQLIIPSLDNTDDWKSVLASYQTPKYTDTLTRQSNGYGKDFQSYPWQPSGYGGAFQSFPRQSNGYSEDFQSFPLWQPSGIDKAERIKQTAENLPPAEFKPAPPSKEQQLADKYGIDPDNFTTKDLKKIANNFNYAYTGFSTFDDLQGMSESERKENIRYSHYGVSPYDPKFVPKKENRLFGKKLSTDGQDEDMKVLMALAENNDRKANENDDLGAGVSYAFGLYDGFTFGLTPAMLEHEAKKKYLEAGLPEKDYVSEKTSLSKTLNEHPIANVAGNLSGSLPMFVALGGATEGVLSQIPKYAKLAPAVKNAINLSTTVGITNAISSAASQNWNKDEWYKQAGKVAADGIFGAATAYLGGRFGTAVTAKTLDMLKNTGLSTRAIHALSSSVGAFTFAGTTTGASEVKNATEAVANGKRYTPNFTAIATNMILLTLYAGVKSYAQGGAATAAAETEKPFKYFAEEDMQSPETLKARFRTLGKEYHPDVGGNTDIMAEINAEYARAKQKYASGIVDNLKKTQSKTVGKETQDTMRKAVQFLNEFAGEENAANLPVNVSRENVSTVEQNSATVDNSNAEHTTQSTTAPEKSANGNILMQMVENSKKQSLIDILRKNEHSIALNNDVFSVNSEDVKQGENPTDTINKIFDSVGNVAKSPVLGTVDLNKKGAKSTVFHGVGKNKVLAAAAIKNVIENGEIYDIKRNYDNRGYDTYVIAGRGELNGEPSILGVVVKSYPKNNINNKFYVHEVIKIGAEADTVDINGATRVSDTAVENATNDVQATAPTNLTIPQRESVVKDIIRRNIEKNYTPQDVQRAANGDVNAQSGGDTDTAEVQAYKAGENTQQSGENYAGAEAATELTIDEEGAILRYKSGGSYRFNGRLRGGKSSDIEDNWKQTLNAGLDKMPVYEGVVYRNIGFQTLDDFENFIAEHKAGNTVTYPAFTSSSKSPTGYEVEGPYNVHYEIYSKNGRDVENIGLQTEQEVMFKTGSSFNIHSSVVDGNTLNLVLEEVVHNENTGSDNNRGVEGSNIR